MIWKSARTKKSLKGSQLKVSVMGSPPYVVYGRKMRGVDLDLLNILGEKFQFSYQLKLERSWGRKDSKTGNWSTGTIGSVQKHT